MKKKPNYQALLSELEDLPMPEDRPLDIRQLARIRERFHRKTGRRRRVRPALLLAAALVAALALTAGGVYLKWTLPQPQPLEGDWRTVTEERRPSAEEPLSPTDEQLCAEAARLLRSFGLSDEPGEATAVRSVTDHYYQRELKEVVFPAGTVTFAAKDGALVSISPATFETEGPRRFDAEQDAAQKAREYYLRLPVQQGYQLVSMYRMDDDLWEAYFSLEAAAGIYSDYEAVKMYLSANDGRFLSCTVFHIPLLDDHLETDVPLTREEAVSIALEVPAVSGMEFLEAEQAVVLPNYFYEIGGQQTFYRPADVTRLAWVVTLETPDSDFITRSKVFVDLYTGEVLGGDATK